MPWLPRAHTTQEEEMKRTAIPLNVVFRTGVLKRDLDAIRQGLRIPEKVSDQGLAQILVGLLVENYFNLKHLDPAEVQQKLQWFNLV